MSVKALFAKPGASPTLKEVEAEIARLDAEADRLEYDHWKSQPHLDAAKAMRMDASGLRKVQTRLLAGDDALPEFVPRQTVAPGDLVRHRDAIWQCKQRTLDPPREANVAWVLISGKPSALPQSKAAPSYRPVDITLENLSNAAGENPEWYAAVKERLDSIAGSIDSSLLRRPPTVRFMLANEAALSEAIGRAFKERDEKIEALSNRIGELKNNSTKYQGVWRAPVEYARGDLVTLDGSIWHCNARTRTKPGDSTDWTLAVKRGRDGRDKTK